AEELVRMEVDIIVAAGSGAPLSAARRATSKIPIVMTLASDPVGAGLVKSLARPGGNVTGGSSMTPELGSKRLELLKEVVPRVAHLAVLCTPAATFELRETRAEAQMIVLSFKLMATRDAD